jgi:hypothetical protein
MSSAVLDLLSGYFSEELLEERPIMRSSLYHGGPVGVEETKAHEETPPVQFELSLDQQILRLV